MEHMVEDEQDGLSNKLKNTDAEVSKLRSIIGPNPSDPNVASLQQQVADLRKEVNDLKQTQAAIDSASLAELKLNFEEKVENDETVQKVIIQALANLEDTADSHDARITVNMAKTMADNIKVGGLAYKEDEDPIIVVQGFFENIMELKPGPGDIIEASRMKGSRRVKIDEVFVDLPPLMFVECSANFRNQVEQRKGILKDKCDEDTKIRFTIRPHLPDAHYAVRQRYNAWVREIIESNKGKSPQERQKFKFKGEEFYVDGKLIVEKIKAPRLSDICQLSPQTPRHAWTCYPL